MILGSQHFLLSSGIGSDILEVRITDASRKVYFKKRVNINRRNELVMLASELKNKFGISFSKVIDDGRWW